jgi:hypothetical protein
MNLHTIVELQANRKLQDRIVFQGLHVSIENRQGSVRKGKCEKGKPWSCWRTKMKAHYGYLTNGIVGVDGDKLDVFIGPDAKAKNVFVVNTRKAPTFKNFDEHKCMLGWNSAKEAKKAFIDNYGGDVRHFGSMVSMSIDEFKKKALNPKTNPQKLTKMEEAMKKVAAEGEPNAYGGGMAHYESTPTFHPPSLKKPQRVPADNPGETDDRFLDVTKRKEASTKKFRTQQTKKHTTLGGIPPNTAVQHHTGVGNPFVTNN